jgi:Rps23 Pro-64 3,4-dihydroxylase Tpa1-like proline 4-hydroxylase
MTDLAWPTSRVAVFDEFLVGEEWRNLVDFTFCHGAEFQATQVLSHGEDRSDHDARRSVVLFELDGYRDLFVERLMTFFPQILVRLDYPWFPVRHVEVQLTGTGDGEFFRAHSDDGSPEVAARAITFVYFFHREPRPFSGGELRIYDTAVDGDHVRATGPFRSIWPLQNQVVFFPSYYLHEILPVNSPSGSFFDRRFTVNGWFHR